MKKLSYAIALAFVLSGFFRVEAVLRNYGDVFGSSFPVTSVVGVERVGASHTEERHEPPVMGTALLHDARQYETPIGNVGVTSDAEITERNGRTVILASQRCLSWWSSISANFSVWVSLTTRRTSEETAGLEERESINSSGEYKLGINYTF